MLNLYIWETWKYKNGQLTITGPFGELRRYSIGRHATTAEKKQKFCVRAKHIVIICHFKVCAEIISVKSNLLQNGSTQCLPFFGLSLVLSRARNDVCLSVPETLS